MHVAYVPFCVVIDKFSVVIASRIVKRGTAGVCSRRSRLVLFEVIRLGVIRQCDAIIIAGHFDFVENPPSKKAPDRTKPKPKPKPKRGSKKNQNASRMERILSTKSFVSHSHLSTEKNARNTTSVKKDETMSLILLDDWKSLEIQTPMTHNADRVIKIMTSVGYWYKLCCVTYVAYQIPLIYRRSFLNRHSYIG
jgi:hypothetical protein